MIISHKYWLISCNYGQLKKISIVSNHPIIITKYQNYVLYSVSLNSLYIMQFPKWYHSMGYIMFNKIIFCLITSLIIVINLKLPIKMVILEDFTIFGKTQIFFSKPRIPTFGGVCFLKKCDYTSHLGSRTYFTLFFGSPCI